MSSADLETASELSGSLGNEDLITNDVTLKVRCGGNPFGASYSARGTATGAFPGTFAVSGGWGAFSRPGGDEWNFRETFTIDSKPYTVNGAIDLQRHGTPPRFLGCNAFGPVKLGYGATVTKNGKIVKRTSGEIDILILQGKFRERLH